MSFLLTPRSIGRLVGVHPKLVAIVEAAVDISTQDFFVVEGVRAQDAMCVNWGKGRSAIECTVAGVPASFAQPTLAKVTWLANPFNSNHRVMEDGFGHAVDLGALVDGQYDGVHSAPYDAIALAMFKAASAAGVHIRWGGDWDGDGHAHEHGETDLAHFELV